MTNDDTVSRALLPVASFVSAKQAELGLDDEEIAAAAKLPGNAVALIKCGKMKLPIAAIKGLADRLNIAPQHLLRIVIADYLPALHLLMEELTLPLDLTKNECELLGKYRRLCEGRDAHPVVVSGITLVFWKSL